MKFSNFVKTCEETGNSVIYTNTATLNMHLKTAQSAVHNSWSEKNDQQLIEQIAEASKTAMTELISRYYHRILDFAFRHLGRRADAEDIAQETFIRVWQKAPTWRDRQFPVVSWIYRISHNLCIDEIRKRKPLSDIEQQPPLAHNDLPEDNLYQQEQQIALSRALQSLSVTQRTAVVMCNYQGISNRNAAAAMDISIEALESLLRRGRNKLRKLLIDNAGIQP